MSKKRKQYSASFKSKVALAALKGPPYPALQSGRYHQTLDYQTPDEVYYGQPITLAA